MKYRKIKPRQKNSGTRYFRENDGYYWVYTPKESYVYLPYLKEKIYYSDRPLSLFLYKAMYKEITEDEFKWGTGDFKTKVAISLGKIIKIMSHI